MRRICFFISFFLVFAIFPFGGNIVKAEENIVSSNHKDGVVNFSLPKQEDIDSSYGWNSETYLFRLDLSNERIKELCLNGGLYVVVDNSLKYDLKFLNGDYSTVQIGLSYGINDTGTRSSLRLRTNVSGYNTLVSYTYGDKGFPDYGVIVSHTLTLCCADDSINLNDFVVSTDVSIDEFNNFEFTGYRMFPGLSQGSTNAYGFDITVGFCIPCNYSGLDGVVLSSSKNSSLKDEILKTIKDTSVLLIDGKKINLPKNKISVHFYEPTKFDTVEEKQKYGFYTLSEKGPFTLYDEGDKYLRGTIVFHTGNVPQVSKKINVVYSSNFTDKCINKYFSLKGYEFLSTTYSCEGSIDFIKVTDDDGDGFDDITGQGVGTKYDENGNHTVAGETVEDEPNRSNYDDGILGLVEYIGDLIVYWIKAPFISIANGFTVMINSANSCFEWFSNFGDFLIIFLIFSLLLFKLVLLQLLVLLLLVLF